MLPNLFNKTHNVPSVFQKLRIDTPATDQVAKDELLKTISLLIASPKIGSRPYV
jgi:hypothetical protein